MSHRQRIRDLEAEVDELRERIAQLEAVPRVTQVFKYEQPSWYTPLTSPYTLPQVWC